MEGKEEGNIEYNMDKRTRRKADRTEYQSAINEFRKEMEEKGIGILNPCSRQANIETDISVFIRKRPIFSYEEEKGEYDVITISNDPSHPGVVVSQCRQRVVPKRGIVRQLGNVFYPCTQAFDENVDNHEIYQRCGKPLLDIVDGGGIATCFMFGQTGSGKTHTMSAIQRYLAGDLVSLLQERSESKNVNGLLSLEMIFYELVGKKVYDLLEPTHKELKLLSDSEGKIHVSGATRVPLNQLSSDDIVTLQREALERRETSSTGSNATSSRSHAICQIIFSTSFNPRYGVLTLVDLAGSERKEDSCYHDRVTQLQTAEINTSLMALKDCLRTKSMIYSNRKEKKKKEEEKEEEEELQPQRGEVTSRSARAPHIPYRNSNLTRILKESFETKKEMKGTDRDLAGDLEGDLLGSSSSSLRVDRRSVHGNPNANVIHVIFTLTPTATNTEHSITNLNLINSILNLLPAPAPAPAPTSSECDLIGGLSEYVTEVKPLQASLSSMRGIIRSEGNTYDSVHPSKWNVEMVREWIEEQMRGLRGDGNENEEGLCEGSFVRIVKRIKERKVSGKELMRWNERRITGEFFDGLSLELERQGEQAQVDRQTRERWGAQIFQVIPPAPAPVSP
jgi:hypothetical protein